MKFKVKSALYLDNKPFMVGHQSQVFEAVKIVPCGYKSSNSTDSFYSQSCKICPGYVQAPWMERSECWGFGGKLFLEIILLDKNDGREVKMDFTNEKYPELETLIKNYTTWHHLPLDDRLDWEIKFYPDESFGKIFVIKKLREATGSGLKEAMSLKEAKDLVELFGHSMLDDRRIDFYQKELFIKAGFTHIFAKKERKSRMLRPEEEGNSPAQSWRLSVEAAINSINNIPWSYISSSEDQELLHKLQTVIRDFLNEGD